MLALNWKERHFWHIAQDFWSKLYYLLNIGGFTLVYLITHEEIYDILCICGGSHRRQRAYNVWRLQLSVRRGSKKGVVTPHILFMNGKLYINLIVLRKIILNDVHSWARIWKIVLSIFKRSIKARKFSIHLWKKINMILLFQLRQSFFPSKNSVS